MVAAAELLPLTATDAAVTMHLVDVLTDSAVYAAHDNASSPVGVAIAGADRQYLSFAMEPDDVVFAEKGSFHAATVNPVLNVSLIGTSRRGWIDDLPVAIQWLPAIVTAPFRMASSALGRTAAGESAFMLTVRATRSGVATFVNHSGGQIQRVPLGPGETLTARRGA